MGRIFLCANMSASSHHQVRVLYLRVYQGLFLLPELASEKLRLISLQAYEYFPEEVKILLRLCVHQHDTNLLLSCSPLYCPPAPRKILDVNVHRKNCLPPNQEVTVSKADCHAQSLPSSLS